MSTTKFEHVIGRDGLHRIRKTCVENGEIIDCSHEGFSSPGEARENEVRNFKACLGMIGMGSLAHTFGDILFAKLIGIPTVDERTVADPHENQSELDRRAKVFLHGEPVADPLDPQTMDLAAIREELARYRGAPQCMDCKWKLGTDITDNCSCRGNLTDDQKAKHTAAFSRARELQTLLSQTPA